MARQLNGAGFSFARGLIRRGNVNTTASWSFSASDGNAILGGSPEEASEGDWNRYGRHHLARNTEADQQSKAGWSYPFAKRSGETSTVYRSAIVAIRSRAGQQEDKTIFNRAGELLEMIDAKQEKATQATLERMREQEFRRECWIRAEPDGIDEEERTAEFAFSSETPVDRFFGTEVLDHSPDSVRMDRLNGGAAVLVNHNHDDQVGVVLSARIDPDKKLRAKVKFSRSERGQEIFRDVQDGIRRLVSIGYRIWDAVLEEHSREDGDTYRITDWEPYEGSLVAVPADASVGHGRAADYEKRLERMDEEIRAEEERIEDTPLEGVEAVEEMEDDATRQAREVREAEVAEIRRIAGEYRRAVPNSTDLAESVIELDGDLAMFKTKLREAWMGRKAVPVPVTPREPRMEMTLPRRSRDVPGFGNDREGLERAYRMGKWVRAEIFGDQKAVRWCKDYGVRVMTTSNFSAGGAVVPTEMADAIIDLRDQYGAARRLCFIHPMESDATTIPRRSSGVTAYFVGQETATTASDKAWDQVNLNARELSALTRMSRAYAEDAVIDASADLANEMAYAFAVKEDQCWIDGDGTSTYGGIYGMRTKLIADSRVGGVTVATATHNLFSEIDHDDLAVCRGTLPDFPGIMPRWLASKTGKNLVFDSLKAAAGGNTIVTLGGPPSNDYIGDPIETTAAMPAGASTDYDGVVMLIYGDFRMGAVLGDRRGFAVQVLNERYAEYRQVGIIGWQRFDIVNHGLGDSSAAGPIVGLVGSSS